MGIANLGSSFETQALEAANNGDISDVAPFARTQKTRLLAQNVHDLEWGQLGRLMLALNYSTIPKTRAAEEKKGFDLASATVAAIKAGQDAGRIVDNLELLQKAKDLEKKWQMDSDKAEAVRIKLAEVAEERLQQAILTPDSKLDAWEAAEILNSFNATDSASAGTFVDTMMLRNSVQREIDVLYEKEAERDMFQADASEATTIHRANLKAMDKCQDKLKKAKQVSECHS